VESKIARPSTATQRKVSAQEKVVAFGVTYTDDVKLTQKTLENFNKMQKRAASVDKKPIIDDETVPMMDRKEYENDALKANTKPP